MISLKYRDACVVFLKKVWSSIHHALRVVIRRSRVESNVAPAPQDTGPAVAPNPTASEDTLAQIAAHLEYLGYEVRPDGKDWSEARHPHRYDFHLRVLPTGIRLHCTVGIGAAIGNSRAAWMEFLNSANEHGYIAQFSLFEDSVGRQLVRMRAFVNGAYSRAAFAVAMDMWHYDLDRVRQKPEFVPESDAAERAEVAVTVN